MILLLSAGVFFLPERDNDKSMKADKLMWEIVQPSRYISTDDVAKMIIEGDPTLILIDVRSIDEYDEFTLQKAVNIPLDSLNVESYQEYLGIEDMNAVFFSNDDIKADQAWVLAKRKGYQSIYIIKGGLNCWINTIITPPMPKETDSKVAFELYSFRKGASLYFSGVAIETPDENTKTGITIARKKKKSVAEGGC